MIIHRYRAWILVMFEFPKYVMKTWACTTTPLSKANYFMVLLTVCSANLVFWTCSLYLLVLCSGAVVSWLNLLQVSQTRSSNNSKCLLYRTWRSFGRHWDQKIEKPLASQMTRLPEILKMQTLHDGIDYILWQNPVKEIDPDEVAKSPRSSKERLVREIRVIITSNQTEVIGLWTAIIEGAEETSGSSDACADYNNYAHTRPRAGALITIICACFHILHEILSPTTSPIVVLTIQSFYVFSHR